MTSVQEEEKIPQPLQKTKKASESFQLLRMTGKETSSKKIWSPSLKRKSEHKRQALHDRFFSTAKLRPQQTAVEFGDTSLTFSSLASRAKALSSVLRRCISKKEEIIAIWMDRGIEMIIAMFGVLAAGATYLPIDPSFPVDRISYMLQDSSVQVVLTQTSQLEDISRSMAKSTPLNLICVDQIQTQKQTESSTDITGEVDVNSRAYVIYTSGSTGKPKGVQIEHQSVDNTLDWIQDKWALVAGVDKLLSVTTISFDISVLETIGMLCLGVTIHILPRELSNNALSLSTWIEKSAATCMQATPATWQMLLDYGWKGSKKLKKIFCGGERLTTTLATSLLQLRIDAVWNMYGPTETTIWISCSKLKKRRSLPSTIPIGKAMPNTFFVIVNESGKVTKPGEEGELLIGGIALSRGYLNRPELNQEKFILFEGQRVYKTGDACCWTADGEVVVRGRTDNQVKIRGYRIEVEEIEEVLVKNKEVRECVVVPKANAETNEQMLVAYIGLKKEDAVAQKTTKISELHDGSISQAILNYAKQALPIYMVPHIVILTCLPRLPNGKLDRKYKFPEVSFADYQEKYAAPNPSEPLQEILCRMWEDVLGLPRIGINDNFFLLGGTSIAVSRLTKLIKDQTSITCPVHVIHQFPTVQLLSSKLQEMELTEVRSKFGPPPLSSLTASFSKKREKKEDAFLVAMNQAAQNPKPDSKRALFLVHGAAGLVGDFWYLAFEFDKNRPIWAIQSNYSGPLEKMASLYIDLLKEKQPLPPYYLSGYSLGGVIALEMAKQLKKRNEETRYLGMVDTGLRPVKLVDSSSKRVKWWAQAFSHSLKVTRDTMYMKSQAKNNIPTKMFYYMLSGHFIKKADIASVSSPTRKESDVENMVQSEQKDDLDDPEGSKMFDMMQAGASLLKDRGMLSVINLVESNLSSVDKYLEDNYIHSTSGPDRLTTRFPDQQFGGPIRLYLSDDQSALPDPVTPEDWLAETNQFEISKLSGDHYSILWKDNANVLSCMISQHLDEIDSL